MTRETTPRGLWTQAQQECGSNEGKLRVRYHQLLIEHGMLVARRPDEARPDGECKIMRKGRLVTPGEMRQTRKN